LIKKHDPFSRVDQAEIQKLGEVMSILSNGGAEILYVMYWIESKGKRELEFEMIESLSKVTGQKLREKLGKLIMRGVIKRLEGSEYSLTEEGFDFCDTLFFEQDAFFDALDMLKGVNEMRRRKEWKKKW
jgi:predicted transcriptional regulator